MAFELRYSICMMCGDPQSSPVPLVIVYNCSSRSNRSCSRSSNSIRSSASNCRQRCQSSTAICDFSIVVAFGHNELWRPKAANRVSVTSQVLWPSATTNSSGGRRLQKWILSWLKYRQMAILQTLDVKKKGWLSATTPIVFMAAHPS